MMQLELKQCNTCRKVKAVSEFHHQTTSKDGKQPWCKECRVAYDQIYYAIHRGRGIARSKAYYESYKEERKAYSRTYGKTYYATHREERKAYAKSRYYSHREEEIARAQTYRIVHLEERKAYNRSYYADHREEKAASYQSWYESHREEEIARAQAWHKANPDKVAAKSRRRRARIAGVNSGPIDYKAIKVRDRMRCCVCGKKVKEKDLSFDHSIPISLGGPHIQENLRVCHRRCNSRRGTGRLPVQMVLV